MKTLPSICVGLMIFLMSASTMAASGTVSGKLQFYNNQGNYCPTTRNCTGAQYTQSEYNVNLPVRNAKVFVREVATNNYIGSGVTDSAGNFSIAWSSPNSSPYADIDLAPEHQDGRFAVRSSTGSTLRFRTNALTLINNGNKSYGTKTWGTSSSPTDRLNLYDGAWRTWDKALKYSNLMLSHFTNVDIYTYDPVTCSTSCANSNRIIIDSAGSAYMPQERIMHEMGHVASQKASLGQSFATPVDYSFDGVAGWSSTSQEWASAGFEEGLATFIGSVAIYWGSSPDPHTCLSTGVCNQSIENSLGSGTGGTSCPSGTNRQQINIVRYLWDLYDTVQESNLKQTSPGVFETVVWDDTNEGYHWFLTGVNTFNSGRDNRGKEEPYDTSGNVDDLDGRSAYDFYYIWEDLHANSDYDVRKENCLAGVGD